MRQEITENQKQQSEQLNSIKNSFSGSVVSSNRTSKTVSYGSGYDSAMVTYSDDVYDEDDNNISAVEQMAKNSVLYMQTDDEATRASLAAQNQMLGQSMGYTYDSPSGQWYTDESKTERVYFASTDWDAGTKTFGK